MKIKNTKIKDIHFECQNNINDIRACIKFMSEDGWELAGPVSITYNNKHDVYACLATMVKYETEEEKEPTMSQLRKEHYDYMKDLGLAVEPKTEKKTY